MLIYFGGLLAICLLTLIALAFMVKANELIPFFIDAIKIIFIQKTTYFVALLPYGLFLLGRNLKNDFKLLGIKGLTKGLALKVALPIASIWVILSGLDLYRFGEDFTYEWDHAVEYTGSEIQNLYKHDGKQRGIHVFGLQNDTLDLEILKKNHIEWITFVPFISQKDYQKPLIGSDFGKRDSTNDYERLRNSVAASKRYGFHLMLKPHIWLSNPPAGVWRSKIEMKSEADWDMWFENYGRIMLTFASLAEELGVEIFCVGVELHTVVASQPQRWHTLIAQIKEVYTGELTYAANWSDNLEEISFWDQMDYLGVQAYYPIAQNENPELTELEAGWNSHIGSLKKASQTFNKPILFTEIGYKSTTNAGIKPWEWNSMGNRFYRRISHKTQALCYQAFFNTIWKESWFAGAHIWEWQGRGKSDGKNNGFTVEGKPALNILAKGFSGFYSPKPASDSLLGELITK